MASQKPGWPKIDVGLGFALFLAGLYVFDVHGLFFYTLLAIAIHELAHVLTYIALGGRVAQVKFTMFGIKMRVCESRIVPYSTELWALFAGPAASLATAFAAAALGQKFGEPLYFFAGLNLVFCLFNLLPAAGLDGGQILQTLFCMHGRFELGYNICKISTLLTAAVLFFGGAYGMSAGAFNLTIFIAAGHMISGLGATMAIDN